MALDTTRRKKNISASNDKGEAESRRKVFRLERSKIPLVIITFLLLYVSLSLGSRFDQLYAMQRDLDVMQTEVRDIREKNSGLQKQLEMLESQAYVEQVAREKLGLVMPGEARIVPMSNGTESIQPGVTDSEIKD